MKHFFIEPAGPVGHYSVIDEEGDTVCNPSPMGQKNAALIYAAPSLVDACAAALGLIQGDETLPQSKVEALLVAALKKAGQDIRWAERG